MSDEKLLASVDAKKKRKLEKDISRLVQRFVEDTGIAILDIGVRPERMADGRALYHCMAVTFRFEL